MDGILDLTPQGATLAEAAVLEVRSLYQTARGFLKNHADAWDLVQDTLERALRHSKQPLPRDVARRWLLVTLRHLFLDNRRAQGRRRAVPLVDELPAPEVETSASSRALWRLVDDGSLAASVRKIDPRLREVYELHVGEGLPLTAVAQRLGIPISTAGTRLFRARQRLRATLEAGLPILSD